jgi:hypothetical protein
MRLIELIRGQVKQILEQIAEGYTFLSLEQMVFVTTPHICERFRKVFNRALKLKLGGYWEQLAQQEVRAEQNRIFT